MASKKQSAPLAPKTPMGLAHQATAWLSHGAPASAWRDILAFVTGLLTVVTLSGGLVYWLPWLQVGVVAGIATGLVATSTRRAATVAAAAVVPCGGFVETSFYALH